MANATARTEEGVPSQPQDVSAKFDKGGIVITVSWKDPKDHNGIIIMYSVYFEGKRGYDPSFTDNHQIVSGSSSRSTEIGVARLKPGTEYSIYVKARTVKGYGAESVRLRLKTLSKRPPRPKPPQVVEHDVTTTTITISLSPSSDHNGEIIRHEIIVEMLGTARARRETTALPKNIYGYEEAQTNGDRFYIAAMFEKRKPPAEFVLGNGKTYGDYKNVPLKPGTRYNVYVRGVTERDGKWLYGEPAAISQLETVAGGWSEWNSWRVCSKPVGGIQTRERECNISEPAYGGKHCYGTRVLLRECNNTSSCNQAFPLRFKTAKNPSVGRMEIYTNNSWEKLCTSQWDEGDLNSTCMAMGYYNNGVYVNDTWYAKRGNASKKSSYHNCTIPTTCEKNLAKKQQFCKV
ncbi:receptor-type tyrosine-protein phosphatase kappa-like [Stylophora pistillata]|uniref:receptor-type tyrosine-protein phosphatase kappa-like n=1 Tax=Stylophora pistillata TaxID=50429 RepID=UPI000C051165|nr:receptor-type tyrosine-protein phosphatase kappa-like [Stylophora pistillata]